MLATRNFPFDSSIWGRDLSDMWKMAGPSEIGKMEGWLEKAVLINTMSAAGEMRISMAVSARRVHPLGIRLYLLDVKRSVTITSYNLLQVFSIHRHGLATAI